MSLEVKIERNKNAYCDVLQIAPTCWHEEDDDFVPFIKYLTGAILSAYRDFEDRMQLVDEKLPAVELVRRATQKKIGKFTKSEIMATKKQIASMI